MDGRASGAGDPHEAAEKEWIEELKNKIKLVITAFRGYR
jgi:hypothetical protein